MWVKICANTNVEDALAAAELGANALGFVFAASSRQVTASQVRAVISQLSTEVEKIGVFAGFSVREIAEAARTAGLTGVQLHDGFRPQFTSELRALLPPGMEIIETAHWRVDDDAGSSRKVLDDLAAIAASPGSRRVLIDAKVGSVSGGTGVTLDWSAAASAFASQPSLELILAGGLDPRNVAQAIRTVRPWGVDIASGVESSAGCKDHVKLATFIKNARQA